MNTIEQLQRRATLAVQTGASTTNAQSHIHQALIHARAGRIDLGVIRQLEGASASLARAIKLVDQNYRRVQRKIAQQEAES